jgi:hypothetical protein
MKKQSTPTVTSIEGNGLYNRNSALQALKTQETLRSLGWMEHLFWLLDQNWPIHFALTALITGKASKQEWQRALDRVQNRHPILSVGIDGAPGDIPQFRRQAVAPVPLRIVEGDPKKD